METEQDGEDPVPSSSNKHPPDTPDIDDKVANFLAEIQSIDPETEEEDPDSRPSFQNGGGIAIPPPTFSLNASQSLPEKFEEVEKPMPKKSINAYKSMFVKGESEFVRSKEDKEHVKSAAEDTEWPEEPTTVWQRTLDDNTQYHYYWNTVTNEVTWEIPPDYTRYLLLYKEYEEKVAKLKKEGKVKPPSKAASSGAEQTMQPISKPVSAGGSSSGATSVVTNNQVKGESVSSSSEITPEVTEVSSGILKNKETVVPILPDSTNSKAKTPQLVAYHGGSSAESSTDSSEDSESEEDAKKTTKRGKDQEPDDLDLDDIDKALEMALEKKKSHREHKSRRKSSESKSDKDGKGNPPKSRSLVDAMREQVQQKQELEARRKAAIEEMMARELERRVGPPRKRPTPEEPSLHGDWEGKRAKVMEYEHGRRSRRDERDSQSRTSSDKDYDRDSRHKKDDHKKHKKDDRERKREDKKREDHRKKDKQEDRRRDEKKRHKDKERDREKDEKRKDKKRDRERDGDKEEKAESGKSSKEPVKEKGSEEIPEEKKEAIKKEPEPILKKEPVSPPPPPSLKKPEPLKPLVKAEGGSFNESHLTAVQLANLKMQASELVELGLSKLEFLEVTKKGLSKLQILLVELETRQQDWQSGGLSTEYFLLKLEEANRQLQQYEQSAAPPGWSCHWDRAYRRYFYMNKKTNQTQWDYPEEEEEEEESNDAANTDRPHSMSSSPQKDVDEDISQTSDPGPHNEEVASSSTTETDRKSKGKDSLASESQADSDGNVVGHPNSMDIEDPSEGSSGVSQPADGEPVSSTGQPASEAGVPDTTSILSVMDEIYKGKAKHRNSGTAPVSQSYDYSNSTAAASVMQGEPPPPGTDLDLLLAAPPPPPPPPDDDNSTVALQAYNTSAPLSALSQPLSYTGLDGDPMVHSSVADSMYPSESGLMSEESTYGSERNDASPLISQEPIVIARPPQVFSKDEPGSSTSAEVVSGTESAVQESLSEEVTPAATTPQAVAAELPSSSGIASEKKKKKKDKSMSGSGLHLKKKNVTSLVQKWQKVKKEVEIEERNREEREQAIRQKLEEWKQEYSW
ncbi:uncharacterized protein LOC111124829 isoform X3 [Crassostrea virginica]